MGRVCVCVPNRGTITGTLVGLAEATRELCTLVPRSTVRLNALAVQCVQTLFHDYANHDPGRFDFG